MPEQKNEPCSITSRRRKAEKAGDAAMDAVIAAAKKTVEKAAYGAAVAECKANNAAAGTAEMVMQTVLDIAKLSEAELIEWRESGAGTKVYALYDNNAHVAYAAAMKVFYHATMAAMDEAGDAFDTAYAASMREAGYLARAS
jgi:predicted NodU family carbamoyl transferase